MKRRNKVNWKKWS